MSRAIVLNATSPFEEFLDRKTAARIWANFMTGRTSSHSSSAATLPYIMRRCEREQIPYLLEASPGYGYGIRKLAKLT